MNNLNKFQPTDMMGTPSVERSLLEYLKPKSEERYSKIEAFCDLLNLASSGGYVAKAADRQIDLIPGQFVASISELARKWQWQRATVRQFIDGLVALNQLSYEPFVKNYIFTLKLHQRLSIYVKSEADIVGYCILQFYRVIMKHIDIEELVEVLQRYFQLKFEFLLRSKDPESAKEKISNLQYAVFKTLVHSLMEHSHCVPEDEPQEIFDTIYLLFGRGQVWNWRKVCALLIAISQFSTYKKSFSLRMLSDAQYTSGEYILSSRIIDYYKSVWNTNEEKTSSETEESSVPSVDASAASSSQQKETESSEGRCGSETLRHDSAEGNQQQ